MNALAKVAFNSNTLLEYAPESHAVSQLDRRLLISCDTGKDLEFAVRFAERYCELFKCVMVEPFPADAKHRLSYLDWLSGRLGHCEKTVVLTLIGADTGRAANVDWDIAATVCTPRGQSAGLCGLLLPSFFEACQTDLRSQRGLPKRLTDYVEHGYAQLYTWEYAMQSTRATIELVEQCLSKRQSMIRPAPRALQKPAQH